MWLGRLSTGEEGAQERWEIPGSRLGMEIGKEKAGDGVGKVDERWGPEVIG